MKRVATLAVTYLVLLLGDAILLTPALAHAAGGDLLWQDQFDFAGGQDFVNAVAAGQGRIVAVGSAQNGAGNSVIVRAYDAKSGTLLWKDRVDLAGGNDRATAVVMNDRLVVVAGSGVDATGNAQRIIRAYVPKSGALAWEDRSPAVDVSGLDMEGAHIVVTGTVVDATGSPQLLVRAYVAKSGALAWEDHTLSLGPSSFDSPRRGVTLHGGKAFVTRSVRIRPQDQEPYCLVRAYDAETGRLLWESIHTSFCRALAIATDGERVLVAGQGSAALDDFLVQSYDADTGEFLWEDRTFVGTGFDNAAIAVDTEGKLAFIVGWVRWVPGTQNQEAFLIRAYDSKTGELRWEDQFPSATKCLCHARDVVADKGRVFAVGHSTFGNPWFVRAYDASRGDILWHDEFVSSGNGNSPAGAVAVATDGGRVFVGGSGANATGNADFILRTYDAK